MELGLIGNTSQVILNLDEGILCLNDNVDFRKGRNKFVIVSKINDGEGYMVEEIVELIIEVINERFDNIEIV